MSAPGAEPAEDIVPDTSSIEAFVAGFAAKQKGSLEFLMESTDNIRDLKAAMEKCGNNVSGEILQTLQYISALALRGLEECFSEYNAYKDEWLPAVSVIRKQVNIHNASETMNMAAVSLVKLIQGMQVIINSIMSISDQYKFIAEEANVRFEAMANALADLSGKGEKAENILNSNHAENDDYDDDEEEDEEGIINNKNQNLNTHEEADTETEEAEEAEEEEVEEEGDENILVTGHNRIQSSNDAIINKNMKNNSRNINNINNNGNNINTNVRPHTEQTGRIQLNPQRIPRKGSSAPSQKQLDNTEEFHYNEVVRVGSSTPGPRPEERAQLRRGAVDQDNGVSELSEELDRPQTSHEDERLKGDLRISCARLATAREEHNYLSYAIRNEAHAAQLRKDIKAAKAHGESLDDQLIKLLTSK